MTRLGIFVLLQRPPGTVQSNMKTRQRIFYKFSLSWLQRLLREVPGADASDVGSRYPSDEMATENSSGRQHTDVFTQRQ